MKNSNENYVSICLTGTGPLSFELKPLMRLAVKKYGLGSKSRPTAGLKFKSDAYLVFNGPTKVGRISSASLKKLEEYDLSFCDVSEVDMEKNTVIVTFHKKIDG